MVYINKNNAKIIPKTPGDLSAQAQRFPRVFFLGQLMGVDGVHQLGSLVPCTQL